MSQKAKTVTAASFTADVLESARPVLVDYWAEWCGPCRMIGPLIEESATEYADRLTVAKLNIDESGAIARRYAIRSIPTLMLFKAGVPVATHVGTLSRSQLHSLLDSHVPEVGAVQA